MTSRMKGGGSMAKQIAPRGEKNPFWTNLRLWPLSSYLLLNVCVLEHQCGRSDVLLLHALTAAQVDGVLYAFINLLGTGIPVSRIGQLHERAVCE